MIENLENGRAFPGVVRNDTAIFATAASRGLKLLSMRIVLPESTFQAFSNTLDAERRKSQYAYGYPDGDGDCNCVTWIERLGLPLLTGTMIEFARLLGWSSHPTRRFGACI
jgi:hypothetical protein